MLIPERNIYQKNSSCSCIDTFKNSMYTTFTVRSIILNYVLVIGCGYAHRIKFLGRWERLE